MAFEQPRFQTQEGDFLDASMALDHGRVGQRTSQESIQSTEEGNLRVRITISGGVQGAHFRHSAAEKAAQLGLQGKVCNLFSGDIQIVAEGPRGKCEELAAWAQHPTNTSAEIADIRTVYSTAKNEFQGFELGWD